MTDRLPPTPTGLDRAAALLRRGDLVAFPTETVYGLGADARDANAVARIFAAKGRPRFNPLIVHVSELAAVERLVTFCETARALAQAFWPGPLTLVLPLRAGGGGIAPLVTAGLPTLAVRVPAAPVARDLLFRAGCPVAAPSANPSGRVSPTTAEHVLAGLDGQIAAVVDGGACAVGLESTILAPTDAGVRCLRPGGLPAEVIEAALCAPLLSAETGALPSSPGQLASHYAPMGRVRLNVETPEEDETLLGFGPVEAPLNLSRRSDLVEAAAALFGHLQALDAAGTTRIAVSPIPERGLGIAINDRLRRAAAPRN